MSASARDYKLSKMQVKKYVQVAVGVPHLKDGFLEFPPSQRWFLGVITPPAPQLHMVMDTYARCRYGD